MVENDRQSSKREKRSRQPMLTHTSILILSSFLVGIAVQRLFPPDQVLVVLGAGVVGMLAYLGLDYAAKHRAEVLEQQADEATAEKMEGRLHRHVPPSMQFREQSPAQPIDWQTLVAVAEKGQR